jgi:hypothetical protein
MTERPCVSCDHEPACGHASIVHDGREDWYCHDDDHSCYVQHVRTAETLRQFYEIRTEAGPSTPETR